MKNTNKKGFTIVELVIVIAVIAILAAVLIPTFASIVKKANIAADTQLAKNLNTVLTTAAIGADAPEDFSEVLKALRDNGFIISNINPTTEGWYYVWESDSNQILLVDGDNNYEIKYQSKEIKAENQTPGKTWNFAVSNADKVAAIKALGSEGNRPYVVYAPKTTEALEDAFGDTFANGGTIAISSDILMGSGDFLMQTGKEATRKVTMDLSGNTVTNTSNIDYVVTGLDSSKRFGQLTAAEGTLVIANGTVASHSSASFVVSAIENGKVELSDVTIDSFTHPIVNESGETVVGAGVALRVLGVGSDMQANNVTINLEGKGGGCEIGLGTATFDNVNITVNPENAHFSGICVSASRAGTLTINSGTYTAKGAADGVLGLYTSVGNIVINGGTFVAEQENGKICNPYKPSYVRYTGTGVVDDKTGYDVVQHTIELNGGIFKVGNKTVDISALTDANYESEIKSLFGAVNYEGDLMSNLTVSKTDSGYKVVIK